MSCLLIPAFPTNIPPLAGAFKSIARYIIPVGTPFYGSNPRKGGTVLRLIGILVAAAAIVLGACATRGHPIHNVENAPVILPPGKSASMQQVTTAIMRAGSRLGWQMQPERPGKITGRYAVKNIMAVVDVEHDTKSYSIKYRDSSGLNAEGGTIHQRYNTWIHNLDRNIKSELSLL